MDLISGEQALGFLNDLFGEMQTVTFNDVLQSFEKLPSAFGGMTNGEVMKAIFPDIEVTINEFLGSVVIDGAFGKFVTTLDWWLDSYKAESEGV